MAIIDITIQLIQRINKELSDTGGNPLTPTISSLAASDDTVGAIANYAQIVSTNRGASSPGCNRPDPRADSHYSQAAWQILVQAYSDTLKLWGQNDWAALQAVSQAAAESQGTLALQGSLDGAAASGIGAFFVLFLSVALAALSANNPTTSPEMQQLAQIDQLLVGLENVDLAKYWGDKASNILSN